MKIPEHKFLYKGSAELPFVFYTAVNTLTATNIVIQPGASSDLTAAKEIHITGESHLQGETHIFTSPSFIDCNNAELDDFLMQGRKASIVQAEPAEVEKAKREIEVLFNKSKIANSISVFSENYRGIYTVKLNSAKNDYALQAIEIIDLLGRKIISSQINSNSYLLDLSGQPKGVYLLQTSDGSNFYYKKIIVQ